MNHIIWPISFSVFAILPKLNLVLTEDFAQDFDKKMVIPIPRKGLWNQKFTFENRKNPLKGGQIGIC